MATYHNTWRDLPYRCMGPRASGSQLWEASSSIQPRPHWTGDAMPKPFGEMRKEPFGESGGRKKELFRAVFRLGNDQKMMRKCPAAQECSARAIETLASKKASSRLNSSARFIADEIQLWEATRWKSDFRISATSWRRGKYCLSTKYFSDLELVFHFLF